MDGSNDEFINRFIDEFIEFSETKGLVVGGAYRDGNFEVFVCSAARYGSPTELDITAIKLFLDGKSIVTDSKVSGLVDANYGI